MTRMNTYSLYRVKRILDLPYPNSLKSASEDSPELKDAKDAQEIQEYNETSPEEAIRDFEVEVYNKAVRGKAALDSAEESPREAMRYWKELDELKSLFDLENFVFGTNLKAAPGKDYYGNGREQDSIGSYMDGDHQVDIEA
ncbi:MAG: hypothetical protein SVV03_04030 [Candidatus Nanohaloarchaea archaeon]|nr:hypothetical protein [Candidatus Nanohaloarchaea archaeon]